MSNELDIPVSQVYGILVIPKRNISNGYFAKIPIMRQGETQGSIFKCVIDERNF